MNAELAEPVSAEDHIQGPAGASITLVQYGDFECPYTRMSRHSVQQLQRELGNRLRFVFRHFPLREIHPHALAASRAAEAAGEQGKFWEMHEYIFSHQHALDDEHLLEYAVAVGLDVDRYQDDKGSAPVAGRIERDVQGGIRSGVRGTPTFFINGRRHHGSYEVDTLRAAISAELPNTGGE
jgi:protein-disulfide isomerase